MRILFIIIRKEFKQIFRNKAVLPIIFVAPIIQLLILPLVANYEVKDINLAIVDNDHSSYSNKLVSKIGGSPFFHIVGSAQSYHLAFHMIEKDKADVIMEIPNGFEKNLVRDGSQKLFLAVNAINGVKANLGSVYLMNIIADYNNDVRLQWIQPEKFSPIPQIEVVSSNWFNPLMKYHFLMVPGILVMLVTMVASIVSALNIVKEKEIGTIEQINVTPIKKYQFILGKLIPFWLIGMFVFSVGLLVARLVYGIVPQGHIWVLYLFLAVYLVAMLGFGLLVSTFSDTQQQAMSITFFFIMIFNLMSGLFTPVDSMPEWAKTISQMIPVSYFIDVMRMNVLKGSGLSDIMHHLKMVGGIAILLNAWAIISYRKRA